MIDKAISLKERIHHIQKYGLEEKAFTTGFSALDGFGTKDCLNFRLAKGRFMVVTGIPNMGKSEVMDAMVLNMAVLHGWKTLFFSPENNPADEHLVALVEKYVGKKITKCSRKECDDAVDFINDKISWTCPEDKSIDNLLKIAEEHQLKEGLDWFIIDPWNYVKNTRGGNMIHEHLSDSLNTVTTFTRNKNVLVTIVAHPSNLRQDKNGVTQMPDLYTISDGAMWRNKCDYGIVIHRPDMSKDEVEFYVGKRRKKWMGNIGMTTLDYDKESGRLKGRNDKEFLLPSECEAAF